MKSYFASRISDNISETPEGYLICHDVPIARTGTQEYMGCELGLTGSKANVIFKVTRPPEEVFAPATLASFEGKTFTNDHPPNLINSQDTYIYEKGHGQNVRKANDNEHIICDIFVKETQAIQDIKSGKKREISAGYNCDLVENENGFIQTNIRGNHIALVENGRAGSSVCIKDEKNEEREKLMKIKANKSLLAKAFKKFVMDAEPDEVADGLEIETEEMPKVKDDGTNGLEQRLTALEDLVKSIDEKLSKINVSDEEPEKTALDELEKEVKDEAGEDVPKIIEPEDEEPPKSETCDKAILKDIREAKKIVGQIKDEKQRKAVADSMAALIRGKSNGGNTYAKILQTTKQIKDNKPEVINYEEAFSKIKENHFRK